jgi:methylated-DNA-[protein]-cysteine S-methyltransferase
VPPLHLHGTLFQSAVWSILLQIPYGGTMTYGEIAERIRQEKKLPHMSAQAVGQAVGHNPVSIIVPCHRVIGSDGSLTGYAGGLDRKEWMLALEKEKKRCSEKCGGSHRN